MNRMEEALRRAHRDLRLPDSYATPDSSALDRFQMPESLDAARGRMATRVADDDVPGSETVSQAEPESSQGEPDSAAPSSAPPTETAETTVRRRQNGAALNGNFNSRLVTNQEVAAVTVEQYRRLAATLHHAQSGSGIKVVMVASALAGEGKTLTAVNLALTLSESYERRVLLIDADLRRPALHDVFHAPNGFGLNEGLKADTDRKLAVLELSPRLSLLPAGRPDPDPMSVLTSSRMRRVIDEAAAKYDWVLIDTPPVGLMPDAHLLAAMVNAVVLVVQANRTPFALVQRAIESLDRDRVIGVVLNLVDDKALSPGGKYEQYYASSYNAAERGAARP
jgi:capsular exopolysaccharide synthesis family protein